MQISGILLSTISETQISQITIGKNFFSMLSDKFFDVLGKIQLIYWIISIIVVFVIYFVSFFSFCKKTKRYTSNQIRKLKKDKKYIPGIFVELNDGKEMLRYFVYGKKWRKRLIANFNLVYDNYYGEILKDALVKKDCSFYLDRSTSLKDIDKAIDNAMNLHLNFRDGKVDFKPEYDQSQYLFEVVSYPYTEYWERQQRFCKAANCRYVVLTGSAGNGKTNLLCSISELLIKIKDAVVFMNSRDIEGKIMEYMMGNLDVPEWFLKHKKLYWRFINLLLKVRRKNLYIIIDAVNENDDIGFGGKVASFINDITEFSQVKIIVSCRNEYFEERFRDKLVGDVYIPAYVFDVKDVNYDSTAVDRIIKAYKTYFNYSGSISETVKNVLCEQLLLFRIFFELNRNSNEDVNTIRKYELFEKYIDLVKDMCGEHIIHLLDIIADRMFENGNFDSVSLDDIKRCGVTDEEIKNTIDGSILLSKTLVTHEGTILRDESENVYFVFDELRDYYLARRLLKKFVNLESVDSDAILKELHGLKKRKVSCVEGIIHYCYIFFRTDKEIRKYGKNEELCSSILEFYRIPDQQKTRYGWNKRNEFVNLGLRIIMTSGLKLNDMELLFIRDCLQKAPHEDGGILFDYLLQGTLYNGINNLDTYLDILFGLNDWNVFKSAFRQCVTGNEFDEGFTTLDFIKVHEYLSQQDINRAVQIQKVAELFLFCFRLRDSEMQKELDKYFLGQFTHEKIHSIMVHRLKDTFSI